MTCLINLLTAFTCAINFHLCYIKLKDYSSISCIGLSGTKMAKRSGQTPLSAFSFSMPDCSKRVKAITSTDVGESSVLSIVLILAYFPRHVCRRPIRNNLSVLKHRHLKVPQRKQ